MSDINHPPNCSGKRLIVCCDGTWMDSDNGYVKKSFFDTKGTLQVPSNVTRISRIFKRRCSDGRAQIISYESGVGTGSNIIDSVTGGAFGLGLTERVRESYSFLCANYVSGDEIILVGFSRGAFTVRSVAGMVGNLGLLTREGVEHFYPIFKDMQNWENEDYDDPFPNVPFPDKPKGPHAADEYRARLEKLGYTRVVQETGELIKIKAVCVWDTVGSLGIPRIAWLDRIAVWERLPENKLTTDLRQVWFPGNHGNCGGGWADQGMANLTLAWMMDQLASIGVEFDVSSLDRIFKQTADYYLGFAAENASFDVKEKRWAVDPIFSNNQPVRPWGLGAIQDKQSLLYRLSGITNRTPGLYRQANPRTGIEDGNFLLDTNERIHSSVRIRLACQGLGLNDKSTWKCAALSQWRLKRTDAQYNDPVPRHPKWAPDAGDHDHHNGVPGSRWIWEYAGSERSAPTDPKQRILVEEPLGPFERYCMKIAGGQPNVYDFAENTKPQ
ncbi:hypothetical protein HJFPF1_02881 [Paramyrothecium foliicola]|nr:hypothetical protein HJFPF1_02881 [Paramyrothecium foliicola]